MGPLLFVSLYLNDMKNINDISQFFVEDPFILYIILHLILHLFYVV